VAQKEILRIMGENITVKEIGDYAEFLVLAAGGYVSPEAETALRAVLAQDPQDERARYYIGLMMVQTGRPDITFRLWDELLRRGPEDAPWIGPIREQIMPIARLAGVEYSLPAIGAGRASGPSADDIEAASDMTTDERMEMIGGMVAGLSDRLASEGGPPADWARLITSLGVLGDQDQALAVFENAMEVFAGDAGALDIIRAAGSQAGVAE
ncbi:MAG: tetratricopeptide repeat protein, partial [Sulfitobacter sp.]